MKLVRCVLAVAVTIAAWSSASSYTIQTIAVRAAEDAASIADSLRLEGFDAYTEPVVTANGEWIRVRVGCYGSRETAEAVARLLRGGVTREAVVVERTEGAKADGCIEVDVGFVTPTTWSQRLEGRATFDVEIAGVRAVVRHQDGAWSVVQGGSALDPARSTGGADGGFAEVERLGSPFVVRLLTPGRSQPICPGRLLAQAEDVAIVHHGGMVASCHLQRDEGEADR